MFTTNAITTHRPLVSIELPSTSSSKQQLSVTRLHTTVAPRLRLRRRPRADGPRRLVTTSRLYRPVPFLEKTYGRLAMLGFVTGTSVLEYTGMGYMEQLHYDLPLVIGLAAFIGYASYVTDDIELLEYKKPFTKDIELLNGRLAMTGVTMRVLYEYLIQSM